MYCHKKQREQPSDLNFINTAESRKQETTL